MLKKRCPECGEPSYSGSDMGSWGCPHCGSDLSDMEPKAACCEREGEQQKYRGSESDRV